MRIGSLRSICKKRDVAGSSDNLGSLIPYAGSASEPAPPVVFDCLLGCKSLNGPQSHAS